MAESFEIIRSARRKRITFRIRPEDGILEVLAPPGIPETQLAAILRNHAEKIDALRQKVRKKTQHLPVYRFEEGEFFLYRGSWYPLRSSRRILSFDNAFLVPPGTPDERKASLEQLYRKLAAEYLPERTRMLAKKYGLTVRNIRITGASGNWGSCSSLGNVNFSWKLILWPDEIIDYVICHELAHRIELNHSPAFWQEVEKFCPDYRKHWEFLRQNTLRYRAWEK